jgi:hypothetical protein
MSVPENVQEFIHVDGNRIHSEQLAAMHTLVAMKVPIRRVAAAMGVDPSTVRYHLVRGISAVRSSPTPPKNSRAGLARRRSALTKLMQKKKKNSRGEQLPLYSSLRDLVRALFEQYGISSTPPTVSKDLRDLGFVCRKRPRGPQRKPVDPKNRLEWCKLQLATRAPLWFKLILFSDEKWIDCNSRGGFQWVKQGQQPARVETYTWSPKVHMWGCIGVNFRLLVIFKAPKGRQTGASYKRACLHRLVSELRSQDRLGTAVFQYDGDRTHSTAPVMQYLNSVGLDYISDWPARSPDLSPIENLWALLQRAVDRRGPADEAELERFVVEEWNNFDQEMINRMVLSFKGRLERCVEQRGATILTRGSTGQE